MQDDLWVSVVVPDWVQVNAAVRELGESSLKYRAGGALDAVTVEGVYDGTRLDVVLEGLLAYVILGYSTDELKQSPYVVIYGATAILMISTAWAMLIPAVAAVPSRSQSVRPQWLDERRA